MTTTLEQSSGLSSHGPTSMATTLHPSSGLGWSENNNDGGSLRAGFTRINFHGNKVGAIGRTTLMKTTMERSLGLSSLGPIFMATTLEPSSGQGWSENNNDGAVSGPEFTRTDFHGNYAGAIFGSRLVRGQQRWSSLRA